MTKKIPNEKEQFAAKCHLSTFSNVCYIDFSCERMNLTNSYIGPAFREKKMPRKSTTTHKILFTIC